jgi:Flp pilus assembly secretin CpaC
MRMVECSTFVFDPLRECCSVSTRSVSLGSALAAFFCLSTIAGFAILVLLSSGISVRADDGIQPPAQAASVNRENSVGQDIPADAPKAIREIAIHTKAETTGEQSGNIPFERVEESVDEATLALSAGTEPQFESPRIVIGIDRAQIMRLNGAIDTIVIGNPVIADAAVYDQSTLVLTGKAFGETNIIVLDGGGNIIREAAIRVGQPNDVVVVNRGASQTTYSCAPNCSRALRIGDTASAFDATLTQTQAIIDLNAGNGGAR